MSPGQHSTDGAGTPSRHKIAFIVWLAIFPAVLVVSSVLSWLPFALPRVVSVFLTTAVTVPAAVYVLVPWLCRLFDPWVYGRSDGDTIGTSRSATESGAGSVLAKL